MCDVILKSLFRRNLNVSTRLPMTSKLSKKREKEKFQPSMMQTQTNRLGPSKNLDFVGNVVIADSRKPLNGDQDLTYLTLAELVLIKLSYLTQSHMPH